MNECVYLILGISGDLSKRKLIPALYNLLLQKKITRCVLIGAAIEDTTIDSIFQQARRFIDDLDEEVFARLKEHASYKKINFLSPQDFVELNLFVQEIEKKYQLVGNRIIYLAASSQFFCPITQSCAVSGLAKKMERNDTFWHRLVYEKPFGHDLQSAREINACIHKHFEEAQIFRIDHYLTKEVVGNIALVRFTNLIFEPLWNNRYIDNVQISLSETVDIENRGVYYDAYGALKDMVQNHMLELVALIGMEPPEWLTGEYIRTARAQVLEKIKITDVLLGQYEGYSQEKTIGHDSSTETFALVSLMIQNNRWAGVPFYLKTGKCLNKKETVIHIKFKQVDCLLAKKCPSETNYLTIRVTPEASFSLSLNVKKPGLANEVVPVNMEFSHSSLFGAETSRAYEIIFEEIVRGEQSISVRFDEIESSWKIIDAIERDELPLFSYACGTSGPKEMEDFAKKHGMRWRS